MTLPLLFLLIIVFDNANCRRNLLSFSFPFKIRRCHFLRLLDT